jgi:hypothetical protein
MVYALTWYTRECNVIYAIKQYWFSCTEFYKTVARERFV